MSPTKAQKAFFAWSYSRLTDWEACPLKARLKHLDKIPEPKGAALERGSAIHKEAEGYTTGKITKLPASLKLFKGEFKDLRARGETLAVEQQLALDAKWQPCDWFGPTTWARAVIDCAYPVDDLTAGMVVIDYKTGKVRPANVDQLDLYALVMFAHHNISHVDAALWYLDQGEVASRGYIAADIKRLQATWAKRVKPMLADRTFKATPKGDCTWCWYGKSGQTKGGPAICGY